MKIISQKKIKENVNFVIQEAVVVLKNVQYLKKKMIIYFF